jgi:hypothetical protein
VYQVYHLVRHLVMLGSDLRHTWLDTIHCITINADSMRSLSSVRHNMHSVL